MNEINLFFQSIDGKDLENNSISGKSRELTALFSDMFEAGYRVQELFDLIGNTLTSLPESLPNFVKIVNRLDLEDLDIKRNDKIKLLIRKLQNEIFIDLAMSQSEQIFNASSQIKSTFQTIAKKDLQIKATLDAYKEQEQHIKNTLNKQEERISQILPSTISTLGIFVAVLTVVFGGMNLLSAFEAMVAQSTFRLLLSLLITGQIIFNSLFFLMFLISRLSNVRVNALCNKYESRKISPKFPSEIHCYFCIHEGKNRDYICEYESLEKKYGTYVDTCSIYERAFRKYPYIYGMNICIFALEILLGLLYLYQQTQVSMYTTEPILFITLLVIMITTIIFTVSYCLSRVNRNTYISKKQLTQKEITRISRMPDKKDTFIFSLNIFRRHLEYVGEEKHTACEYYRLIYKYKMIIFAIITIIISIFSLVWISDISLTFKATYFHHIG